MPDLGLLDWALLVTAAVMVGIAKTAVTGTGAVAAALFALALPARESTGTLLPLLLVGDVVAITLYRQHTSWPVIRRLFPWVAGGVVVGAFFVAQVGDGGMRRAIGLLLLAMVTVQLASRGRLRGRLSDPGAPVVGRSHRVAAAVAGVAAGFTTMVANSAGSVMTVYLLLSGMAMLQFIGTSAWFFLLVNLLKLPFSIGLGLVAPGALLLDLALLPALAVGVGAGVLLVRRIDQQQFERAAIGLLVVSVVPLLL